MSLTQHVFISYAHEDGRPYRDQLIAKLQEVGFDDDDYWYDERDIDYGEEWRDTIDKALAESFVVLVILTPKATKSHAVTYEWARALGDGLKVIPLLFLKLKPKDEKHPLVNRKQWVDCRDGISNRVIETVEKYSKISPDTIYLNRLILEIVMPLRILARVSLWLHQNIDSDLVDPEVIRALVEKTWIEAGATGKKLAEFMVDKSYAFTSKQRRKCRELILTCDQLGRMLEFQIPLKDTETTGAAIFHLDNPESIDRSEKYREEILEPIIEFFATELGGTGFKSLDTYLQGISEGKPSAIWPMFLYDYLPDELAQTMWNVLDAIGKNQRGGKLENT